MTGPIGKTASITLLTALPGSGKSLRFVEAIDAANKAGEQVYVCNLRGLKLPHMPFPDPSKWQELPPGSVLFVDEVQEFWPPTRDVPDFMRPLNTIRHKGIRLVLATQQPEYLHPYVRGLVGLHEHLLRIAGKEASTIFRKDELMDRVRSKSARDLYDNERWDFPKQYYGTYESAETHTVKYVMPAKVRRGLAMIAVVAAILGYLTWSTLRDTVKPALAAAKGGQNVSGGNAANGSAQPMADGTINGGNVKRIVSPGDYLDNLRPRVAALPYSAPIFDNRQAKSDPHVYCASSGPGRDGVGKFRGASCTCLTEQGTLYDMPTVQCEKFAKYGPPYNPFQQSFQERASGMKLGQDDQAKPVAAASSGSVIPAAGNVAAPVAPVESAGNSTLTPLR